MTWFPLPGNLTTAISIISLTTGPDGNVWFDVGDSSNITSGPTTGQTIIGNVTPAGVVTEFPPIPVPAGDSGGPGTIVSGPGGDLWFSYTVNNSNHQWQNFIGRVTTDGAITLFPISSFSSKELSGFSLAAGADGNLWFAEGTGSNAYADARRGRIAIAGIVRTGNLQRILHRVA